MEKDYYTKIEDTIYQALAHPLRRRILELLEVKGALSFSHLKEVLSLDSGTLNFHLDKLSILIEKSNKRYKLSKMGKLAVKVSHYTKNLILDMLPTLTNRQEIILLKSKDYSSYTIIMSIISIPIITLLSNYLTRALYSLLLIPLTILLFQFVKENILAIKQDSIVIRRNYYLFEKEERIYGKIIGFSIDEGLTSRLFKRVSLSIFVYNRGVIKCIKIKWLKLTQNIIDKLELISSL